MIGLKRTSSVTRNSEKSDEYSFDELFNTYFSKVSGFIFSIVKNDEVARDIAQEIFLRLWEDRHVVSLDAKLGPYLYTIARNRAINHLKHKKHQQAFKVHTLHTSNEEYSQEESLHAKELYGAIDDAVAKMPRQRSEIFTLSRYKGLSNSEIAEKFNITKQRVEYQITTALKELRSLVKKH